MRTTFRAAALAAAAFSLCAAAGFTAVASQTEAAPSVSYAAHADSTPITAESLGLNDLQDPVTPAPEADAEAPVPVHAFAPVLPAPTAEEPAASDEPDQRDGRSLAELVDDFSSTRASDEETDCLARAVYYESKGEPLSGQLTVAEVVINRAESGRFASTICGVVRQPGQFSFVRRGHIPTPPASARDWRIAVAIAEIAMRDLADGAAPRALFFHARHVRPGWRRTRVATIGNHVFYR